MTFAAQPAQRRSDSAGMTLLEVLVALVLVSFVVTLLSQALSQTARIERTLAGVQLSSAVTSVRVAMLRRALHALVPVRYGELGHFEGRAQQMIGLTVEPPTLPELGLGRLRLVLEFDSAQNLTQLKLAVGDEVGGVAAQLIEARTLLSWPGRKGRFLYLDAKGRWQEEWSAGVGDAVLLPAAVMIETGLEDAARVVAVVQATPEARVSRKDVESL